MLTAYTKVNHSGPDEMGVVHICVLSTSRQLIYFLSLVYPENKCEEKQGQKNIIVIKNSGRIAPHAPHHSPLQFGKPCRGGGVFARINLVVSFVFYLLWLIVFDCFQWIENIWILILLIFYDRRICQWKCHVFPQNVVRQ